MDKILNDIATYIKEKQHKKSWVAGKDWVQYAGPYFDENEYTAAVKSLLNEWLVLGTDAITFEEKFPPLLGKSHGILTNSGSSSNLIMMSAMTSKRLYNFKKGTKVITPIAGFPTTINPILQVGFEPVFVDIDLDTLNLNLDQVEQKAIEGAKIITFAHVLGNPPNMDRLMHIIKKYNLVFLEDCCDALGSTYKGIPLGSFGEMSSCSFYPAHHMTMGEGGFVACDSKIKEIIARSFREWGRGCFKAGVKINTNESIKNIEDLRIGDMVISHTGESKRVVQLFSKKYRGDYFKFKLYSLNTIHSTDYHPHLIYRNKEYQWINANEINKTDEFVEKVPETLVETPIFNWKFNTMYNTKTNQLIAEPDLMRLIGYWLAEGCCNSGLKGKWKYKKGNIYKSYNVSFHFNKCEVEYVDDVKTLMKKYFGVSGLSGRKKFKGNSTSICFKSRKAYEFFIQHFNKTASKKSLPEKMVNWKNNLLSELIHGFWRGDGSYCKTNNSFSIATVSSVLNEQIRRILLKFDIIGGKHSQKKECRQTQILNGKQIKANYDLNILNFYGQNAEKFSKIVFYNEFKLKSQREIISPYICKLGYVHYPIKSIEFEKIDDMVYNIEVEDDHSYHADGIATHNCYCVGKKANLLKNGSCGKRFSNWLPELPNEIFDHKYVYDEIGYNLKPIELQASIGLEQIKKLPVIHSRRKENHKQLYATFKQHEEHFILPKPTENSDPSWFAFAITIKDGAPFKRNQIVEFFEQNKIQTRPYFAGNIMLQPAYEGLMDKTDVLKSFPNARKITTDTFFLGVSPVVTGEQIDYIKNVLNQFIKTI